MQRTDFGAVSQPKMYFAHLYSLIMDILIQNINFTMDFLSWFVGIIVRRLLSVYAV